MDEKCCYRRVFLLLANSYTPPCGVDRHIVSIDQHGLSQACAFLGFHQHNFSLGAIIKTDHFDGENGDFQRQRFPLYFSKEPMDHNVRNVRLGKTHMRQDRIWGVGIIKVPISTKTHIKSETQTNSEAAYEKL
jgi:hypothetical protein